VQTNGVGGGPYIPTTGNNDGNRAVDGEQTITITSMGATQVQNPVYCNAAAGACPPGADTLNKTITRDYGFGAPGTVTLGDLGALTCTWGEPITCTVPDATAVGAVSGRQLTVTRANGQSTVTGVTVQVGLRQSSNAVLVGPPSGGVLDQTLQDAIDNAGANDLLLVKPGTYNEMVIMWKPLQLQGYGEGSTTINAIKSPANKLEIWRGQVDGLVTGSDVDLLPGQEVGGGAPEPVTLWTEEGAGILVLAKNRGPRAPDHTSGRNLHARIDGFTIKSADTGGGIVVNGYANTLDISNNRISNNSGFYGGGIRVGHPILAFEAPGGGLAYTDAENDFVSIHDNQVVFNGGQGGVGGGISMCTGADSYAITENWVCGNFTLGDGGGIGHTGVSDGVWTEEPGPGQCSQTPEVPCESNGDCPGGQNQCVDGDPVWMLTGAPLIADNTLIFNETFNQGQTKSGGGLYIGGQPSLAPAIGQCTIPPADRECVNNNDCSINNGGLGGQCNLEDGLCEIQADNECLAQTDCPGVDNQCVFTPGTSPGSGSVQVLANLIQGNSAAAGDGGGIRLAMVNGEDVAAIPYHRVELFNNMIVNNVAALAGGGISLQDAIDVRIVHNTIANNDSLATAGEAFAPNSPNESTPQDGAGIVSRKHSSGLLAALGELDGFSDPTPFADNIIWENRQFFFFVDDESGCTPGDSSCLSTYGLCPDVTNALDCPLGGGLGFDLAVLGTTGTLACDPGASCILTGGADPIFVAGYVNGDRTSVFQPEITTAIQAPPAFDEGGNFIRPQFGPLSLYNDELTPNGDPGVLFGDYHVQGSSAIDNAGAVDLTGTYPELERDIDGHPRPSESDLVDIGADEVQP